MSATRRHLLVGGVLLAAGVAVWVLVPLLVWPAVVVTGAGWAYVCIGLDEVWDRRRASGERR